MSKTPSRAPEYPGKEVDSKQPPTKAAFYDQRVEWRTFLWNPKTKEFLGRNAESWGKITVFYIVFYSFLAGYFAFMMTVLYHTLDNDRPKYTSYGGESILKAPGLGMRPDYRPYEQAFRLVEYDPNNEDSYVHYVNSINHLLSSYKNSKNDYPECKNRGKGPCGFDSSTLRNSESTWDEVAFGYNSISPVIILKLNKVFDWVPQTYNYNSGAIPSELQSYINETMDVSTKPQRTQRWKWHADLTRITSRRKFSSFLSM
ncbi:sodium/potassium-transporting ATPase subunit beta-like isoform X2 [Palaemon carinicauda]|uniref:sodium/potassium-transporting ATPase subunit beta-like isoform X2 n=1 Tax=Palaemon carinicauda TaxID=392227 RepID=UPI0035B5747B